MRELFNDSACTELPQARSVGTLAERRDTTFPDVAHKEGAGLLTLRARTPALRTERVPARLRDKATGSRV